MPRRLLGTRRAELGVVALRRVWVWASVGLAAVAVFVVLLVIVAVPLSSDTLRHRIVRTLSERLDADVAIDDLHWRVFPRLHARGSNLTVRHHGVTKYPPLISIKAFTVDASIAGLAHKRVAHVTLEGLDIEVPPDNDEDGLQRSRGSQASQSTARSRAPREPDVYDGVVIDTLDANGAQVVIIPRKAGKQPKVWAIHTLKIHDVGADKGMPFDATLTNAVPPGTIDTAGDFGPWNRDEPGKTPLTGTFRFARADLSVFKGIGGILSAHGSFDGALARIAIDGETETPDFTVTIGGHPFALQTKYQAVVDGTNGDTYLNRIDASFLQSSLVAKGAVVDAPKGVRGRIVSLDVVMERARIEDVMQMAVKEPTPPMLGALKLTTKFVLPPGETDVSERLQLDGRFAIGRARFTNYDVQGKINELSHRSRGRNVDQRTDGVVSDFQGRFKLAGGRLTLPDLSFAVPGASVRLTGQYALRPETLDFRGTMFMDAKVSQTQSGFKSVLLKVVDPLFRKRGGGSAVPIRIGGTRGKPEFGLDMGRVFKRGDSNP